MIGLIGRNMLKSLKLKIHKGFILDVIYPNKLDKLVDLLGDLITVNEAKGRTLTMIVLIWWTLLLQQD
jgi:hypothetical protein